MLVTRSTLLALVLFPTLAAGQGMDGDSPWRFLTRATLSGSSQESTPAGYEIHSGLALEGAIARDVGDAFAVELSARTESREVEGPASLPERGLGSLEILASSLTLKWQPRERSGEVFQPFAGAGGTLALVWDQSGALDGSEPPIALEPVLQLGSHLVFSQVFLLTVDVKWHPLDLELNGIAGATPVVEIDPLVLGAGFGFTF